jgi:PAS domain S-box-containing protein
MKSGEAFNRNLQNAFIDQTRKILNLNLYTKAILSTLPVAIIATDKDGRINFMNSFAEGLFEINSANVRGKRLISILETNQAVIKTINDALNDQKEYHLGSNNLKLKNKKEIVVNLYIKPLFDEERQFCGLVASIEDKTYINYLMNAFQRYVPASVSEIIARDPGKLKLGGEEKELTVLFSDLIGFTTISEQMAPDQIVRFLSDYFDEMTQIIFEYQGTLKEYVADELMGIFGAPIHQADHAARACFVAVKMQKKLSELRRSWSKQGRPILRARIGINTGQMLVGNLGSKHRFSYGVVGDQVNLASRLEGLSSIYGTKILISGATADKTNNQFHLREIDTVRVKGRKGVVNVYELIDEISVSLNDNQKRTFDSYHLGLELYRQQKWKEAIDHLNLALEYTPLDMPSRIIMDRCCYYLKTAPSNDWEGVFEPAIKTL